MLDYGTDGKMVDNFEITENVKYIVLEYVEKVPLFDLC